MADKLLKVNNLRTSFFTHVGEVKAIRDVNFEINYGESVGIVGESGSGKSVTSLSVMGLLQFPGKVVGGEILFKGEDLLQKSKTEMRKIRGNHIAMIFQDPMTSLNPLFTVGNQIEEVIKEHQKGLSGKQIKQRAVEMLRLVGIPSPESRIDNYPHEFSGGMRQRAMIAMALSCEPELLIADEPTTALDVTIQAQMLKLIEDLNKRLNTATILITHDLGVVATTCSRVLVMYGGQIMEEGSVNDIFYSPRHPYTIGLLKSIPKNKDKSRLKPILGTPPDMLKPPTGCPFYPRCEYAMRVCMSKAVPDFMVDNGHGAKCWLMHKNAPVFESYEKQKGGVRNVV